MNEVKDRGRQLQPPDGGWGWMVVCGAAISQMFIIPVLQNFTLIFKDRFLELEFSSTDITTLVSLNASFGMILGLLNGPLLKIFGFRKMALVGVTVYEIGILCTGIAGSYIEFVIFYGLLTSLGMALTMASFSLAVNSYFLKNRSKAIGYTMTLTGLGPIVLPFVISYFLNSFGLKWSVFLLSGLCLHSYVGAFLLQPVKRHAKLLYTPTNEEDNEKKIFLSDVHSFLEMSVWGSRMSLSCHSTDPSLKARRDPSRKYQSSYNLEAIEETTKPRKLSVTHLDNDDYKNMMNSTLHMIERIEISGKTAKYASAETLDLDTEDLNNADTYLLEPSSTKTNKNESEAAKQENLAIGDHNPGLFSKCVRFLADIYDLDLLRDPIYLNIMLGLSTAFVGEVIFSTMTPIILKEVGLNTEETATFMSLIAGCDLLCRLIAPFVGKKLKLDSKKMYLISLMMLLLSRAGMYLANGYESCLLISVGLGVGKGFRSVFWVLVLPEYVPLSKLPSASAFQSLVNGILILVSGPLIGSVISLTNSYLSIVAASNILTLTTIILWAGEIIYLKYKRKTLN